LFFQHWRKSRACSPGIEKFSVLVVAKHKGHRRFWDRAYEPAGLQAGQFVAETGAAPWNREVLADKFAATSGEDGRAAGETCTLLLASPGRGTSDATAVRGDVGSYRAVGADGVADGVQARIGIGLQGFRRGEVCQSVAERDDPELCGHGSQTVRGGAPDADLFTRS